MSHQEQQQQETSAQDASSVIYTGLLPNGDFYLGTEPPAGGFATDAGKAVMEECPVSAVEQQPPVEQQIDLSMLPQNIEQCFGHPMWDLLKTCVVCGKREMRGAGVMDVAKIFLLKAKTHFVVKSVKETGWIADFKKLK